MRWQSRIFVGVFVLVVAGVAVHALMRKGAPGGDAGGPLRRASTVVVPANTAALRRFEVKDMVVRRLIAGELTLQEAAAWFRYIDANLPIGADAPPPGEAAMSQTERSCRQVMRWAEVTAGRESASLAEEVSRRLRAELEKILRRGEAEGAGEVE